MLAGARGWVLLMSNPPSTMPIWSRYDTPRITCDDTRPDYWTECHWDCCGHCCDRKHDHTPLSTRLYWKSPLGKIVPRVWEFGALRGWWN